MEDYIPKIPNFIMHEMEKKINQINKQESLDMNNKLSVIVDARSIPPGQ